MFQRVVLCVSMLFLLSGCSFHRTMVGPTDTDDLNRNYSVVRGTLTVSPVLENGGKRLIIYLSPGTTGPQEFPVNNTVVAVATNDENKRVLESLLVKLEGSTSQVFIFGNRIDGRWQEYLDGVDFEVLAVSYFDVSAGRYMVVATTYGDSLVDMVKSTNWRDFMLMVGKKAVSAAM